jgi:hypothetical protein
MSRHPSFERNRQRHAGRNAQRKAVRMPATCRSANGLRDEGWLEDISAVGCCFVTRATCFKVGSHVVLRPGGLEGITGIIRWVRANRCGVEFSSPLYAAVVDHLCRQFGDAAHPLALEALPQQHKRTAPRSIL